MREWNRRSNPYGAATAAHPSTRTDYLGHWLSILKADSKAIITAASKAQAAVDHLDKLATPELQEA